MMPTQYQYCLLKNAASKVQYACLQQNPFSLLWNIYRFGRDFLFQAGRNKSTLGTFHNLFKIAGQFLYNHYIYTDPTKLIYLPVYGHVCLKIRRGYKVFDFQRQVVVKLFRVDVSTQLVQQEIDQAREVGKFSFAPTFLRGNVKERWYEEEFIRGRQPDRATWESFLHTFRNVLAPLIENMTIQSQPREVMASDYVRDLHERLTQINLLWSQDEKNLGKGATIRAFMESMMKELCGNENHHIYLTFTHGDFGPRHVLIRNNQSVLLDWEGAGIRSALYDLFDTFFERLWSKSFIPDISYEVNSAISQLQERLRKRSQMEFLPLAASLVHVQTYRFVFYFERVSSYLQGKSPLSPQSLDKILRIIQTFMQYEHGRCTTSASAGIFQDSLSGHVYQDKMPTLLRKP